MNRKLSRRDFAISCSATGLSSSLLANLQNVHANWIDAPRQPYGVMSGEVTYDSAVVWGRSDVDSRMIVHWDTDANFKNPRRIQGPASDALCDWTGRCILRGLPSGSMIHYQVTFENSAGSSQPIVGQLHTPDDGQKDVFFAWSGDRFAIYS